MKKISLTLLLSLMVSFAEADVGSALNDYYGSLSANSKFERAALTTNGAALGGYYQRGSNVDLTMGYVTPPSLKGGCGNIDFNMGAFSFISGDQIVTALKSIGQNAKGLLFTMAVEIVSSSLSGELKSWIDTANKWMGVLKNSCQAANMLMGAGANALGSCQNTNRFNNAFSDENHVQTSCQTYDQGMKSVRELPGMNTPEAMAAKAAMAPQFVMEGGLLQNLLSKYFAKTAKINNMSQDLGNLVLSTVGDIYTQPISSNTSNDQSGGEPVSVPSRFSMSDLMNITVAASDVQSTTTAKSVYNCDFTYDPDIFRAKNTCVVGDKYKLAPNSDGVFALQKTIRAAMERIHNGQLTGNGTGITDGDLTILSISQAPLFQLMQAGVDAGPAMDAITYQIVQKYMDMTIHEIFLNIYTTISTDVNQQMAALAGGVTAQQSAQLDMMKNNLADQIQIIKDQLVKDRDTNKYDPNEVLERLAMVKREILKGLSPDLRQALAFSSTALGNK